MSDDLKIEVHVKKNTLGDYTDIEVKKPHGMNTAEVIGRLEQAKFQLLMQSVVSE